MIKKIWNNNRLWGSIGKLISLLTLVGLLFGFFYKVFAPEDRSELLTSVLISKFIYPADLEEKISKIKDLYRQEALAKVLSQEIQRKLNLTNDQIYRITEGLDNYFYKVWPREFQYGLPEYRGYSFFIIRNKSKIQAENVVIDLPFASGLAQIISEGKEVETTKFGEAIKIGIIRPNKFVSVRIWSQSAFMEDDEKEVQVTHKAGLSQIEFARETFSILGAITTHLGYQWRLFYLGFLVATFLVLFAFFKTGQWHVRQELMPVINKLSACPALPEDCAWKIKAPDDGTQ